MASTAVVQAEDVAKRAVPKTLQQLPLLITLDGPSLCTACLSLALSIHCLGNRITQLLVLLCPVFLFLRNGYLNFLRLGPGGTPYSIKGYLITIFWSIWSLRDPLSFEDCLSGPSTGHSGILGKYQLPYRAGQRPHVAGIAPQRQLNQHGSQFWNEALCAAIKEYAVQDPTKFSVDRSHIEKHGLALFAIHSLDTKYRGEVCHVHDADHSMHLSLHADDIKQVLERGWGQMHPLARNSSMVPMPVSPNFVMIYAPRCKYLQPLNSQSARVVTM